MNPPPSALRNTLTLIGFLVATFCAPAVGSFAMPGEWYAQLNKPDWNPPGWVFGPVWTLLYLMMAAAAWLVWKRDGWRLPVRLYFIQLGLNAAWTPVFFGAHAPGWALMVIILLWLAVLLTLLAFLRVNKAAGWLMLPYLAWVTFATILNHTLWQMNRG